MELTPEQVEAQKKLQDAIAARAKVKADNKARRDKYRAMIGQSFTNGESEATITGFDKDHLAEGIRGESFIVHFGNPNHKKFKNCEKFLAEFQLKGEV